MSGKRGSVIPVQGEDLVTCLKALREDCGCEGRIVLRLAPGDTGDLLVEVQSYTDAGTKLGVARELLKWVSGTTRPVLTVVMMGLHRVYHSSSEKAHQGYRGG